MYPFQFQWHLVIPFTEVWRILSAFSVFMWAHVFSDLVLGLSMIFGLSGSGHFTNQKHSILLSSRNLAFLCFFSWGLTRAFYRDKGSQHKESFKESRRTLFPCSTIFLMGSPWHHHQVVLWSSGWLPVLPHLVARTPGFRQLFAHLALFEKSWRNMLIWFIYIWECVTEAACDECDQSSIIQVSLLYKYTVHTYT